MMQCKQYKMGIFVFLLIKTCFFSEHPKNGLKDKKQGGGVSLENNRFSHP